MAAARPHDFDLTHEVIKGTAKWGGYGCLGLTAVSIATLAAIILTHDPSKLPGMGPDSAESRRRTMETTKREVDKFVGTNARVDVRIKAEHPDASAMEETRSKVWFDNMFKGQNITPEQEKEMAEALAKKWRKEWDIKGIRHQ